MHRRDFLLGFSALTAGAAVLRPARALAAPRPVIEQGFRLVIDPGHGGENGGCRAHRGGVHEKQLTLMLAQSLAGRVVDLMPHAEVLLTREADETLHLTQRVGFANEVEADLFLSLHCNASRNGDQTGFETFLLDVKASSHDAALTAQRENDEGFGRPRDAGGDEVAVMLRELGMTNDRKHAAHYAAAIQREQARRFPNRVDRGVRLANFDVLMGARMPAVLHEVGFLDHEDESKLLLDEGGRGQIVEAIAQATLSYFNEVVRRG
ncbi:N-acetylmuramoyl-L-alanine amidase AmiC precursor [Enhygromyxa salina]|uniref:N-acetylmuramoyl-L-alanine amidase n=1 Tax=Enhygromyxa salina TaxID=215803 RepID=A0A2S9YAH5_9BACT|nr:N-acetylmuramoyl-L-alanine amidase [Enhygromyxa salina]PRQ02114.1 N-acetylmuramoyl-L-alanine amidase AmiC precursor [Enhygromyxa salina]